MTREGVPWLRFLVEGVVIVASILLALGLEAWLDASLNRRDGRNELEALHLELLAGVEILEAAGGVRESHGVRLEAAMDVLGESMGSIVELPDSVLAVLVTWLTVEIPNGTLTSLFESGRLSSVSNLDLRGALAAFPAEMDDLTEDETVARDFVELILVPALAGHDVLPQAYANHPMTRSATGRPGAGPSASIRATPELLDLFATRRMHVLYSERGIASVLEEARDLIEQIESELSE